MGCPRPTSPRSTTTRIRIRGEGFWSEVSFFELCESILSSLCVLYYDVIKVVIFEYKDDVKSFIREK